MCMCVCVCMNESAYIKYKSKDDDALSRSLAFSVNVQFVEEFRCKVKIVCTFQAVA